MTAKQRLVVIGNGMAGGRFVQELLARKGQEHFDVVVFGEEMGLKDFRKQYSSSSQPKVATATH